MQLGFDRRLKQRRLFVSPVFSFGQAWLLFKVKIYHENAGGIKMRTKT